MYCLASLGPMVEGVEENNMEATMICGLLGLQFPPVSVP